MDSSSDNFGYLFQLTKILSSECRANRQERDKIENLLRRLANQTGISYEQLSENVSPKTQETYDKLSTPSEADKLTMENYNLIYQIELQEYMNHKIWALINEIIEHLNSIKSFVIETRLTGYQNIDHYTDEKFDIKTERLDTNRRSLELTKEFTNEKLEVVTNELKSLMEQINWENIPKDSKEYKKLLEKTSILEAVYGIHLSMKK